MYLDQSRTESSNFSASVEKLRSHVPSVHPGWRRLFAGAVTALHAAQCESRAGLTVVPVTMTGGYMGLLFLGEDPVVSGIARKLAQSTACTCRLCGRPGRVREERGHRVVLCTGCWAPSFVQAELREFLAIDFAGRQVYRDDVHPVIRTLVPDSAWHRFGPREHALLFLEAGTMNRLRPQLERIYRALPSESSSS